VSEIRVSDRAGVRHIVLNRLAKRNALSFALLADLRDALRETEALHAIVLSGEGSVFSAGADIAELKATPEDVSFDDVVSAVTAALRGAPVPVFAAIEAPCIGAALELTLACDVRVASLTAFFQLPALRLGILYYPQSIRRLHRIVPRCTLTRLVMLGERIEAGEAVNAGLATHCVAAGRASDSANALAQAAYGYGKQAVAATKALLVALDEGSTDLSPFIDARLCLLGSNERREALARARGTSAAK